jgi:hypothetical protein
MKKLIPFLVLLAGTTLAMAQGRVHFGNNVPFASTTTNSLRSGADRLVGNLDGTPLVGSDFSGPATYVSQLYYGANAGSLAAHTAPAQRFLPAASDAAGRWLGQDRTLTGFAPGQTVTLQVVAWDMRTGATYEAATLKGASRIFTYTIPLDPLSPPAAYFMEGFGGFNLVPEPSVIGLAMVGAGALFMLRRRK